MSVAASMPAWVPEAFRAKAKVGEPLARHTSWHVGGPAEVFYRPENGDELAAFLAALRYDVPILILGLGSNTLVRDGGWRGVVISLNGTLDRLERDGDNGIFAEAGVACARLAKTCVKWKLGPAEFFAGIPGTVGGALAMNAGAWGGETWPHVQSVEVVNRAGERRVRPAGDYRFSYRHVEAPVAGEWFLSARFHFDVRPTTSLEEIQRLLDQRRESQPIGEWSGGSTFVNPTGEHAARLIESAGLKGFRVGGAMVSQKHANFLINEGGASAHDIEQLIGHIQETVARVHGIRLVTEVRIVGEAA